MAISSKLREYFLAGLLGLLALVAAVNVDAAVARYASEDRLSGDLERLLNWSELYAHGLGVLVIAALIWMFDRQKRAFIARMLMLVWGVGLVAYLAKLLVKRSRPHHFDLDLPAMDSFRGFPGSWEHELQSFPSGHTATAVALTIALCHCYPRGRILFVTLAIMAASQRIFVEAHFVSDVLAAAALACAFSVPLARHLLWDVAAVHKAE